MSILPKLNEPNDILLKLCRDSLIVYTSKKEQALIDNFFNFCITAQSLRDWCIKSCSISKDTMHDYCNTHQALQVCRDIANASKHFSLTKDKPAVSSVNATEIKYTLLGSQDDNGAITKPSLVIIDEDRTPFVLKDFLNDVVEAWINVFDHFGVKRDDKLRYTRSMEIQVGDYVVSYF